MQFDSSLSVGLITLCIIFASFPVSRNLNIEVEMETSDALTDISILGIIRITYQEWRLLEVVVRVHNRIKLSVSS